MKEKLRLLDLKSKKVFIIGGSGLIGLEIVKLFLENHSFVVNLDVVDKKKKLNQQEYKNYHFQKFDVSDLENLDKNIEKIIKKFGCPNIFINTSYPITANWNLSSFKKNRFYNLRKNVDIHQNTYCWSAHKICKKMKEKKIKGSVVLLNSIYGFLAQNMSIYKNTNIEENMNYSIIKGGILNFSRQLASYYGNDGIRINSICSGGVKGHVKGILKIQDKRFIKNYSRNCPLGRLALPEEVANSVLFLSSNVSSYITGTSLIVDGGWSVI